MMVLMRILHAHKQEREEVVEEEEPVVEEEAGHLKVE